MSCVTLIRADARRIPLADKSVHCVVTSPPYWNLRDYQTAGQIGLEPTPYAFVDAMVAVFREVHRVLRDDGTLWMNLGDSYGGDRGNKTPAPDNKNRSLGSGSVHGLDRDFDFRKQLIGIPWRVALALQADGWYLRSDIVWHKKAPMPESVTDRPTKSHEYLFLLAKSDRYFYDIEAVKEAANPTSAERYRYAFGGEKADGMLNQGIRTHPSGEREHDGTRNLRTVWTLGPDPFPGAHFATFPRKLVEPCVKAGTSEKGCCPSCGSPWVRLTEKKSVKPKDYEGKLLATDPQSAQRRMLANVRARREAGGSHENPFPAAVTLGWEPSCRCERQEPIACTVYDPFNGSGTTGVVATGLGRRYVGTDLNPEYLAIARRRIDRPHAPVERPKPDEPLPLFSEADQ